MSIQRQTLKIFGEEIVYYSWNPNRPNMQQNITSTQGGQNGQPGIQQPERPRSPVELSLRYEPPNPLVDDAVMITPTAFEQARSSRGARRRPVIDLDSDNLVTTSIVGGLIRGQGGVRETQQRRETFIPHRPFLDLRLGSSSMLQAERVAPPSPPPLPLPTTFNCPICMEPIVMTTATKCGHVFCDHCIRTVVSSPGSTCPSCRGRLTKRDLFRIYLPVPN